MDRPITSRLARLLLLLFLGPLCVSAAPSCPRSCACPQPTELHCTFRSLVSVPSNVNRVVERINLGFNSISKLSEKSLSGLTRLELLLMHGNDLHQLPDGAFKDLRALQMLKLSYNKLREVNRHTFLGLWSLARLHLDHNRLEFIDPDAFHGLTSLRLLQLEGNRLRQIHPATFTTFTLMDRFHLSTLKHLYLSNNSVSTMSKEMLESMPQLENLFLHGNPWICDCNMRWIRSWVQTAPGVLKCKKDRALPGGQLCPMCSSPRNRRQKPLQALDNMFCSSPVINSEVEHTKPEETDNEFTFLDDFKQQFGNVSLGLSDEHGNEVELECSIEEPRELNKISFEQTDDTKMASNLTLSLDLDCEVNRERYERLWRLIAYYSSVPAHLKRGIMLSKDPYPTYVYKQDSDKDALYYTGVKANIMAQPSWLMQKYTDLQLNRHGSSGKKVRLILTTQLSQNLELEMVRRQARTWVVIEATNSTSKTAILGKTIEMQCNVQSSGEPVLTWILPDGTKLVAPSGNPDDRLSISADGRLVIKTAEHSDAGNYFCVAKVEEDFAALAFYLTVQDLSNPPPGEDQSVTPLELFAGSSLNLNCDAFGSPDPEVNWILPNGNIVSFWSNTSRAFVYSNGTLHIPQSLLQDNGFYKCVALNQYGVDTKAAKVILNKRPGMARPLRKVPVRPQSASGVNTKIKVEIKELGEGSGDIEEVSDSKPIRKIIPVRNGVHPSRNTRRRPPVMLRKPVLQSGENGKNILGNRRRVNMAKAKINPERWADILAKIRIKNGQFLTTASPMRATTPQITTQFIADTTLENEESTFTQDPTTLPQETIEGSSDGGTMQEKHSQEFTSTPIYVKESTYNLHTTTLQPSILQTFPYLQHTTSSNAFFLPQTTSAPLQAVTFWQASPNTQSKSMTYPQRENGDKTADTKRPKTVGKRKNKARLSKLKKVNGGQVAPSVGPIISNRDDERKLSETVNKPKEFLQLEVTMVSPTITPTWMKQEPFSTRRTNSKRRNGNRRKKPNRRKQKLNKNMESIATTPASQIAAQPTSSTGLKIDNIKAVTASLVPIDPLVEVQEATASGVSHKASTESYFKSPKTTLVKNTAVQFIPTAFPNAAKTRLDSIRSKKKKFASPPLPPVKPLAQTPIMKNVTADLNLASRSDSSSEGLRHANGKLIHGYTTPKGQKHLVNGTREHSANRSSSVASLTEHKVEEMHHLSSTSGLMTTAGLEFAVTKGPKISSIQYSRADNVEDPSIIPSTTLLPMFTSHFVTPKLATSSPTGRDSTKKTPSNSTKQKHSQRESVFSVDLGIPKTTVTPYLLKDTTKHTSSISISAQNYNRGQQTETKLVTSPQNATQQAPSISVSLKNGNQTQASPTNSISLQTVNVKTTVAPSILNHTTRQMTRIEVSTKNENQKPDSKTNSVISYHKTTLMRKVTTEPPPSISFNPNIDQHNEKNQPKLLTVSQNATPKTTITPLLVKQAPSIGIHPKNDNEANQTKLVGSFQNAILKTTVPPSRLQYTTQQVPSISISSRDNKLDQNIQTKLINSSHIAIPNSTASLPISRDTTQRATRISISSKPDQNSQAKLVTTAATPLADTTQQPTQTTPKFKDFVTQLSDHKLDLFISAKPGIPTITSRTTPSPTFTPFLANLWTEQPQASATPKLPAAATDPRGKPRITKGNFQTMSVKAETDAMLPCTAVGEPKPFLSWTKVSTGTSIPQNTRLQRFEVHKNGTLIIRNTQPVDGGEYLCTVQNQYGSDQVLTNLVVLSQHPKILQPRHRDISVNLGSSVDLDCQVEGHPKPRVTWALPNHAQIAATPFGLASPHRVSILRNGTLRIIQAGFSDRGIYKCVGSSTAGADTVSVRLYVTTLLPVFQQMPIENITAMENGVFYLHCATNGSPQSTIRWTTPDNIQLTSSQYMNGRKIMVYPNGTLFIQSLSQGNAGKYECVASSVMGTSKRTVNLSVKSNMLMAKASIISTSSKLTEVVYGGELKLDCVAKGDPEPRVIWRMPSKKLVDAQYSFDPRIKVYLNGSLTVHSVTDKDGGDYICVARNKIGDDYVVLRVEVLTRPAKIVQKQQRPSQEVVYGGDLKVDCVASGLPNPEISWALPDGTMVNNEKQRQSGGRSRRYVVFDNGTLFFNDVGMREEGDYTCYAENQLGKDEMKIHVKVKAVSSPPHIQNKTQTSPIRVFYGETLTLRCSAMGEPTPTFTWISPTNRLIASNKEKYQVLNDGTLLVQKVQRFDAGDYTCKARNSAGQDSKIIKVEVIVTPPVISNSLGNNFKVSTIQNEQILLDCVAKGTPTPRIMWVLPGNVILPAPYYSNRMTVFQNGTLEIRSPKRSDSGQLACIARNEGGEVRLSVILEVKDANARMHVSGPKMETVSLTVGNAMTLNCSLHGNNLPQVTWVLPNGTPLLSGARFTKFFHRQDGSLIISNPSIAEAGAYRCLGRSGLVQKTVQLAPGRKPEITNRYNSPINVMNGDTLMLHCITNGEPPRLTWALPSGVVLNRPQKAGRYSVLQNGTLAIQQVSVYDRGLYVCRAANEYGSSVMSVSVIVIAYPPRITNGPPSVTYAKRGVAVQLNCAATGIPKVEVAWETPDKTRLVVSSQPRLLGNKYLHPQGSLVIQNPTQKDAGVYRCTARNAIGVDTKATYLNVY